MEFKDRLEYARPLYVGRQWAPYLSGATDELPLDLDENEEKAIEKFEKEWEVAGVNSETLDSPLFEKCVISGKMSDCVEVTAINRELIKAEEQRIETENKLEKLSADNKKTFENVYQAHIKQEEFRQHSDLKPAFRAKLADMFLAAQEKGVTLKLNEPSRQKTAETVGIEKPANKDQER